MASTGQEMAMPGSLGRGAAKPRPAARALPSQAHLARQVLHIYYNMYVSIYVYVYVYIITYITMYMSIYIYV